MRKTIKTKEKAVRKAHTCTYGKTLDPRYLKCYSCDKIKVVHENHPR
jgi:hypothetical protein